MLVIYLVIGLSSQISWWDFIGSQVGGCWKT